MICFVLRIALKTNDSYAVSDEHQYQVQIGSKLIPEYPVKSLVESLSQLRKTVGGNFQMFGRWYRTRKYIIGLDLEKVSGAGCTGMSTKSGDLMTLNFRDCDVAGLGGSTPQRVFCALNYDCVLNVQGFWGTNVRLITVIVHWKLMIPKALHPSQLS